MVDLYDLQDESFNYFFALDVAEGEQPPHLEIPDLDSYRNSDDANYSPSVESGSSISSPQFLTGGDDFSSQTLDPFPDHLRQRFHNLSAQDNPPDNPSNPQASAISFTDDTFSTSLQPLSLAPSNIDDYLPGSGDSTRQFSSADYQLPSQYAPTSSIHVGDSLSDIIPSSAPPYGYPPAPRYLSSRTRSAPSRERPPINQYGILPDVFYPESPTNLTSQPSIRLDEFWNDYTLDGVPAPQTGIFSLGPNHRVLRADFLTLPRAHVRRRSDGLAIASSGGQGTGGESLLPSTNDSNVTGRRRLSSHSAPSLHNDFVETSHVAHDSPLQSQSLTLQPPSASPVVYPDAGGYSVWETTEDAISSDGADLQPSSSLLSPASGSSFEDEVQSVSSTHEGPSNAEEASTSSRIVKHTVTTPAVRTASNARKKSNARFSCNICPQSLTTKGGLRNHLNSHLGLKRFRCSQPNCGKAFTTKYVCTRHERTVHGRPL